MLVPKIFRWLFFNKIDVKNIFDAARNEQTQYIFVDLLSTPFDITNSLNLDSSKFKEFVLNAKKDIPYILIGNRQKDLLTLYDMMRENDFHQVYIVGSLKDFELLKSHVSTKVL